MLPLRLLTLFPSTIGAYVWSDPAGFVDKVAARFRGSGDNRVYRVAMRLRTVVPGGSVRHRAVVELERRGELSAALAQARGADARRIRDTRTELTMRPDQLRVQAPAANSAPAADSVPAPAEPPSTPHRAPAPTPELRVLAPLTNSLPYTQSGYSLRTHGLLAALAARGVGIDALTRPGYPVAIGHVPRGTSTSIDGVHYHRNLPCIAPLGARARLASAAQGIATLAARTRPQLLHTTSNFRNGVPTAAAAQALGLPWIYEVRGQEERTWLSRLPKEQQAAARESEFYRLAHAQEQFCMSAATHVIVLSDVMARALVAQGHPPEKLSVVPNAVDARAFRYGVSQTQARERLGLPAGPLVGSVSALVGYEGFDTLIRAVQFLPSQYRVVLVGDGAERPHLEHVAARLGVAERVIFAGQQPASDVWQWYRALDVFVVPRRNTEVCRTVTPIKPMAAQALGVPVVASDLPALREVTGGFALYSEAEDAAALAASIRAAAEGDAVDVAGGREFARTRTWPRLAEQVEGIYRRLA